MLPIDTIKRPPKTFEANIIRRTRCVGMIAFCVDGRPSFWPCDLPAEAVPVTVPVRTRK